MGSVLIQCRGGSMKNKQFDIQLRKFGVKPDNQGEANKSVW